MRFGLWVALAGCVGGADKPSDDGTLDTDLNDTASEETDSTDTDSTSDCAMFPADNPWNTDISAWAVHSRSGAWVSSAPVDLHPDFGTEWAGAPNGIPYFTVTDATPRRQVAFTYADESDPGPYPIPDDPPIEGGPNGTGDRHIIGWDSQRCQLYELFNAWPAAGDDWTAGSGAIFNLTTNALRPDGWTSADAAGLPILPGLVRYDEVVEQGVILHALRFTVDTTQRAYIHPATHAASSVTDPNIPPMGARFRLRSDHSCSGYSPEVQVICTAMKTFGLLLADNGSDGYISGAPDPRWDDDALRDLSQIPFSAFEAVDSGEVIPY